LLHRLGYQVTSAQLTRTVAYYLERTAHGSTLSEAVTAWVLARTEPWQAWRFFLSVLESDIGDVQGGTTAEGIHLGAMAGTLDIAVLCFAGMHVHSQALRFDPALPPEVRQLRFSVLYRGHRIEVFLSKNHMSVRSRPGRAAPIKILVCGRSRELTPGGQERFRLGNTQAPDAG